MLILTRKAGQAFFIGEGVKVTITEIFGDKVKIGIEAPYDQKVLREELYQTLAANRQAIGSVDSAALRALAANLKRPESKPD